MNKKQKRRELIRIVEYLVSGGLYFWVGYGVFFVTDSLLGWSLFYAKMSASVLGWLVNYLLQRFWVFRSPELSKHKVDVTSRYILVTLVNFFLDYLIVYGLQLLGISPYIGQFISAGFFTVWNYVLYKTFVFTTHLHRKAAKPRRPIVSRRSAKPRQRSPRLVKSQLKRKAA